MEPRAKRIFIISGVVLTVAIIALLIYAFFVPKLPATQNSDKTVIIDNYSKYLSFISSDSFGYLGNYLYEFIKDPEQGVYHATIVDDSYSYSSTSWFSKFTVKLEGSDIVWKVSMQTIESGEINGDIAITCESGAACLSISNKFAPDALQDYLPITTNDFIMTYQSGKYDTLSVVYYDQEGTGKAKALEKITSLGFKPEDYKIEYFYGGR